VVPLGCCRAGKRVCLQSLCGDGSDEWRVSAGSGVGGIAGIDESECLEGRVIVILAGGPSPLNAASEGEGVQSC
jgi:hypothetical protein